jgi:hypothetical protein
MYKPKSGVQVNTPFLCFWAWEDWHSSKTILLSREISRIYSKEGINFSFGGRGRTEITLYKLSVLTMIIRDIIHRPVFYLKQNIRRMHFISVFWCNSQLSPIDSASLTPLTGLASPIMTSFVDWAQFSGHHLKTEIFQSPKCCVLG